MTSPFAVIGRFSVRRRWLVLLLWTVAAVACVRLLPSIGQAVDNNNTQFLPASDPSNVAARLAAPFNGRSSNDDALVVAATVIGPGGQPTEFDPQVTAQGGYGVVLAELAPGQRVTLQVTDAEPGRVRIGDRVDTRLRRLYATEGEWRYGRKAVPRPTGSRRGPS